MPEPVQTNAHLRAQFAENARKIQELEAMRTEMQAAHKQNGENIDTMIKMKKGIDKQIKVVEDRELEEKNLNNERLESLRYGCTKGNSPNNGILNDNFEDHEETSPLRGFNGMPMGTSSDSDGLMREGSHSMTVPFCSLSESGGRPTENVLCNKAYKNMDFMSTPAARNIRIQCEFQEPGVRLAEQGVHNVVMFFGSARAKSREEFDKALEKIADPSPDRDRLLKTEFLVEHYEACRELARKFTIWNMNRHPNYLVATGGGPGMMKAANEGAWLAGGRSVGFGISLPFEKGLNPFVTEELAFEFHYFFTRKFWMAYKITGLVVAPGGFGTLDELFELLTLKQTGKIKRPIPVVLFGGKSYWNEVLNLQAMCNFGMISQSDVDEICCTDDVDEALNHMIKCIESFEVEVEEDSPNSPFVAPMVDKSGAYVRDERGRVCKRRTSEGGGSGFQSQALKQAHYGPGAMSCKDSAGGGYSCKDNYSDDLNSDSKSHHTNVFNAMGVVGRDGESPKSNDNGNNINGTITSGGAGSKKKGPPEESIV